jgi:hypothetical protein
MLANPPFGVEWKSVERAVKDERERLGFRGRFGAGLPAINDGSLLFLQHMISKMRPTEQGGSRLAIGWRPYKFAFSVHDSITRGIWRVTGWDRDETRWGRGRRGLWQYLPARGGQIPYTILV